MQFLLHKLAESKITYEDPDIATLRASASFPAIDQAFRVDPQGNLLHPLALPLSLTERRPAFAEAFRKGEIREFQEKDYAAAIDAYQETWKEAWSDAENAEVLNALGRCALALGDRETAVEMHRKLTYYNHTFDADGAHPATLSHLRLADHLDPAAAIPVLTKWAQGLVDGRYPLYPGCRQALDSARDQTSRWQEAGQDVQPLLAQLAQVEHQLDFAEDFSTFLKNQLKGNAGYISGVRDGRSFLAYTRLLNSGELAGLLFDLEKLRETLTDTPTGRRSRERGFDFVLFDIDYTPQFRTFHQETVHTDAPASQWIDRMRLGLFVTDVESAMDRYRKRNLALLTGIFVLVGFVALGGYAIFRDTSRELRLARLRSEFVSNVSHELRTPLAAIRMNAETLLTGRYRTPEKHDEFLQTVVRESERLSRLVDNILAFSQIESGRKTYDFQACDLGEIVRAALEPFEPLLRKRDFQLQVDIAADLAPLQADRDALVTVVSNLLGNAIKYSPQQREIAIAVREQDKNQLVEVADRGIGVPPADRQRIFEKFHRAANASSGAATGAGVGLSLTRSIADAHGGSVEMEPRGGGGSLFRLILPQTRS